MIRIIARSFASASNINVVYRNALMKDIDTITRRTVKEGWHVGPHDFQCGFAFDPKGVFIGEVDGELVSHIHVTRFPKHSAFVGGHVVTDKFRRKGIALKDIFVAINACNQGDTIGSDVGFELTPASKKLGYKIEWDSYVATLSPEKIVANLAKMKFPSNVAVNSIHNINLEKLLDYDSLVFGTERKMFMERWIKAPGSFGFATVDKNCHSDEITGYAVIKQVIRGGGTEIGLAVAPLYADSAQIAKVLLKTSAEYCLLNEAVPKTTLEMFHPVGDNCGQDAPQLMNELEAELTHIGYRMYNKGLPPGRKLKKIYGIASPSFD